MANDEKYNGWTNRETWLVNLWYGDYFTEAAEETGRGFTADEVKEIVEETVYNDLLHFKIGANRNSGLLADIIGGSLARINWQEIAEHTEVLV